MTLKDLSESPVGACAAALLQRARAVVIAHALTGIVGVLVAQLAIALRWTTLQHYTYAVVGSLCLYALALAIGHVGNAREQPLPTSGRPRPQGFSARSERDRRLLPRRP